MKPVDVKKLDHKFSVTIRIHRQFYIRLWIAKQLFKLGAMVLGCGIEFIPIKHGEGQS